MGSGCSKKSQIRNIDELFYEILLDWKCNRTLDTYHWWPMKEAKSPEVNNLYCEGGGLNKYDILFDTYSQSYQRHHHFRSHDSEQSDSGWAGFCDKASILSCHYKYPIYDVTVKYNGKNINFTPKDIEMLMILACDNTVKKNMLLFLGERHNSNDDSDINEPYPMDFLHFLRIMCSSNEPFVMDIDDNVSVWNYSYDIVYVTIQDNCPLEFNLNINGYNIKYLNFKIGSSAYPDKNLDLWGYMYMDNTTGVPIQHEGWISDSHPDFLWKKYAKETAWTGRSSTNPEIDCYIVYQIYRQSISDNYNTLEFV